MHYGLTASQVRRSLLVISGPSASGKTTLANSLVDMGFSQRLVSHTTRPPRDGEKPDTYYFVSAEDFAAMKREGELVESSVYDGHHYGLSYAEIRRIVSEDGLPGVAVLDISGFRELMAKWHGVWGLWLDATDEELARRLAKREDQVQSARRLELVGTERELASSAGYAFQLMSSANKAFTLMGAVSILRAMEFRWRG